MPKSIERIVDGQIQLRPIIRWAGGKRQLLPEIHSLLPKGFDYYVEPFLGGAAVALSLPLKGKPVMASDLNKELINFYQIVQKDRHSLFLELDKLSWHTTKGDYLKVRDQDIRGLNAVQRAARFFYLNKLCYNGVYRENSKGKFNVPYGGKERKPEDIVSVGNITALSIAIKDWKITAEHFVVTINKAKALTGSTFMYVDPPYLPKSDTACFTNYTKFGFTAEDWEILAIKLRQMPKNVKWMVSSSDNEYIVELFKGFNLHTVFARRNVNRDGDGRGAVKELLITNY